MNKIVIAGCGFAGFETALRLKKKVKDEARIVVVDKNPVFSFDPWLHRVLRGADKKSMGIELAPFLSSKGIKFINSTITGLDHDKKILAMGNNKEKYDFLVVALGHVPDLSVPGSQNALQCNSFSDIENIKQHIDSVLSANRSEKDLTIIVCGGSPDGVSLSAEINEYLELCCLNHGVRRIDVKLILIESGQILKAYPMKAKHIVEDHLSRNGIDVRNNHSIKEIKRDRVIFRNNSVLGASTIIWCGDYKPNPLVSKLGFKVDRKGAATVNSYLQTSTDATIYSLGNCASIWNVKPEAAENASSWSIIKQAKVAAHNLASNILGGDKKDLKFKAGTLTHEIGSLTLLVHGNTVLTGFLAKLVKNIREKLWWMSRR